MMNAASETGEERSFIEPIGGYGREFDDRDHRAARGPLERLIVSAGDIVDDVIAVHGGEIFAGVFFGELFDDAVA